MPFPNDLRYSAGKVSNENWCGSCRINAYFQHPSYGDGALALTNAHVATRRVGDMMKVSVVEPGGGNKTYDAVNLINAYSTQKAIDWALIFIKGLTAASGIEPVKVLKTRPEGSEFQLSGSPKCVFPPKTYQCRHQDTIHDHVYRYMPNSIGGSSGSGLVDSNGRMAILNAWSWGGYGAGMSTAAIWGQMVRGAEGWETSLHLAPDRDPDMIELDEETWKDRPAPMEGFQDGSDGAVPVVSVRDYPIWWDEDTEPDDPDTPLPDSKLQGLLLKYHKEQSDFHKRWAGIFGNVDALDDDDESNTGNTFGLD